MSGQLTVLSILVAVVPLLCIATLGYVFYDAAYREKTQVLLAEKAMSSVQNLDGFLEEKIANLRQETGSASITELSDPGHLRARLHSLQNAYQGVFLGLDLVDASGTIIAGTGDEGSMPVPAKESWFAQAISRPSLSAIWRCARHPASWPCESPPSRPPGCCGPTSIRT